MGGKNSFRVQAVNLKIDVYCLKVIETRMNSMFELATQEEIDKLGGSSSSGDAGSDDLVLDDVRNIDYKKVFDSLCVTLFLGC